MHSMTGFASCAGTVDAYDWAMDVRTVNNKGLDLRLRVPDWLEGVEAALRKVILVHVTRGSLQLSLKINKSEQAPSRALDVGKVEQIMSAAAEVQAIAKTHGVPFAPIGMADVLTLNGFTDAAPDKALEVALKADILANVGIMIANLIETRHVEGQALHTVLSTALVKMREYLRSCQNILQTRQADFEEGFKASIARVYSGDVDQERLAQELAILAVKTDVTEELDRLATHISAAHDLLDAKGAVGRKFDFLMQEFNREANTLCSKSSSKELTQIGLQMKVTIDQMREQIQNVE